MSDKHMESAEILLSVNEDATEAIIKVKCQPKVCCVQCISKFTTNFLERYLDNQKSETENLH